MNKLIEFNVQGGTVIVESQDAAGGSVVRGTGFAQLTEKVGRSLEDTLSVIRPFANAALAAVRDLSTETATAEIEFGVKFDVKLGVVLSASTEGTLRIKLVSKSQ